MNEQKKCEKCNGYGGVEVETGNPSPPGNLFDSYECPECGGTGVVCGEHKWTGHKTPDTPDGPGEYFEFCDVCGMERGEDD